MITKTNLLDALLEEQGLERISLQNLAKNIWEEDAEKEREILNRISNSSNQESIEKFNDFSFSYCIQFDLEVIKNVCLKYRLRFLPSKMYKGDIPQEALMEVRRLEAQEGQKFDGFKIIAPSERFVLKDSTADPILIGVSNNRYFFIHQWGNDMEWWKKWMNFPLRNTKSLMLTSLLFAFIIGAFMPMNFINNVLGSAAPSIAYFTLKFHVILVIAAGLFTSALIAGLVSFKDFSANVWTSKFFN